MFLVKNINILAIAHWSDNSRTNYTIYSFVMKNKFYVILSLSICLLRLQGFSQEKKVKTRGNKSTLVNVQSGSLQNNEGKPNNSSTTLNNSGSATKSNLPEEVKPVTEARPIKSNSLVEAPKTNTVATPPDDLILNNTEAVITQMPNGNVNWTQQYVEAKGISIIDNERFKNPAQAKAMATRGAVVVAQRNLLEIIKGVNVTSETKVQDMMTTSDFIYSRIDGIIQGAQQVGEPIEKNGAIEVSMRVPLYDKNGLAPIVVDKISSSKRMNEKTEVSHVAEIKPEAGAAESLEQVIFNLAGKKYDPSMFPVILDKDNNVVFDYSKFYDPKSGKFPKIIEASGKIMEDLGFTQGKKIVDLISAGTGKLVIDNNNLKKVNWEKIGTTAAKIGKFLLMFI